MKARRVLVLWALTVILGGLVACELPGRLPVQPPDPASTEVGADAPLLTRVRQLTFEGRRAGEGYFSHDGSWLVFQSEREASNPFYQIYRMDLHRGEVSRISPGHGKTTCAWIHPGGERVLFASTHHDPEARAKQEAEFAERASGLQRRYAWDYDPEYELWERDVRGAAYRRLTHARGYDAEGSWSPDGRLIVFASNRHAYAEPLSTEEQTRLETDPSAFIDLYRMNADGSDLRRLTTSPGYDGGPFFSADGTKIVWRRFSEDGATAEIFTMNLDGSDVQQITRLGAMSWAPYFHPSGDYIVFATNLHGFANFELYLVDAQGRGEPVRVTEAEGFDGLPVFAPDGARLAWTSSRTADGSAQLFLAAWNDAAARVRLGLPPGKGTESRAPALRPRPTPAEASLDARLRRHVEALTAAPMAGRATGTEGERRATAYVAEAFRSLGLEPAGDPGSYFQGFSFTSGVSLAAGNRLRIDAGENAPIREPRVDEDWRPLAFSRAGAVEPTEVVFAGYGIVAPEAEGIDATDAYAELDVRDRWVLVFRYLPEGIPPETRQHWNRFAALRYKAMLARDRGAIGLLIASGPNAQVKDPLVPLRLDGSAATTSLAVLSISDAVAEAILAPSGEALAGLQSALDTGEPRPGFAIPRTRVSADVALLQEQRQGRNVLARLRSGADPAPPALVIGAHLDHLGTGESGNSLATGTQKGQVHPGADDNASGVAALLEIAAAMVREQGEGRLALVRDVVFAAWSGEELGLLGSEHYTAGLPGGKASPPDVHASVAAYLNLDMVGRMEDRLALLGVGSSGFWSREIERLNAPRGLPVMTRADSYLPTDATAFYLKGVPVLSAFTGVHIDYHTPRDTPDKLDYAGMRGITELLTAMARGLATRVEVPAHVAMERPGPGPSRAGLRAYLGTVPDYTHTEGPGLKLSGVIRGGPAEKAGLQGGDRIVEMAGRTIENIYDYTYAIDALRIGETIDVIVERGGSRLRLRLTPESRE